MKSLFAFLFLAASVAGAQVNCAQLNQDINTVTQKITELRDLKCQGHLPCAADTTYPPLNQAIVALAHDNYLLQTQCKISYGTLYPKFQILTLIYNPPGCTGNSCGVQGDVDYHTGSSSGAKLSTEKSFKNDVEIDADVALGNDVTTKLTIGGQLGWAVTHTDSHSETVTKETNIDIDYSSDADGVNHDKDVFWLLMNPAVVMKIQGRSVAWNLAFKGPVPAAAQINVASLKTCAAGASTPYGLAATDCQVILNQDPFASGSTTIDTQRFGITALYSYTPSTSCSNVTYELKNEDELSDSHAVEKEINAGYYVQGDANFAANVAATLKVAQTFTWDSTSTSEVTADSTQTATFKLACPANSIGQDWIGVYWDVAYGTFMFMPRSLTDLGPQIHGGHVTNSAGQAMARVPVQLVVGGKTFRTATDKNGDYKIFAGRGSSLASVPASGQLSIGSVKQVVPLKVAAPTQIRVQQQR